MTSKEIRNLFLEFFKEKGHTIVPSSSLISDDPSVLFTTAGMQQFKPYYFQLDPETTVHPNIGKPVGKNAVSIQKCFRTSDIDAVGDESHLTFFEMLGNFSFGGYFKEEAIKYAYAFITEKKWMNLKIDYVTVFDPAKVPEGDWRKNDAPFDQESYETWKTIGIPEEKIKREGLDTFWGPTGDEGPCGPTTEIYVKNIQGKTIEIWNIVFNEFYCDKGKKLTPLKTPGVDTGMGLERLAMIVQNKSTIFETDLFAFLLENLPKRMNERTKRIFADYIRGICFLISDGLTPSNKGMGYVLRRLIRRIVIYEYLAMDDYKTWESLHLHKTDPITEGIEKIVENYKDRELDLNKILEVFFKESDKFRKVFLDGIKMITKMSNIDAKSAFTLFESYGLPYELIKELGINKTKNLTREAFDEEFKKHQEISRAGLDKKFGGHGLNEDGEITGATEEEKQKTIKLHTATHLLHQALCDLFGNQIKQMGSDINPERLRFDFPFERKLIAEEIAKLEKTVNQKIKEKLPVSFKEKSKEEAIAEGAKAFFKAKYPDQVKAYSIGDYSKEICNGPHVGNTSEIGRFRILKEESVGAGIRRIKATIEK